MAATGLAMIGWLLLHTMGNTLVFMGQESFNHYAEFIQSGFGVEPALLWLMRALMLGMLVAHIWSAVTLLRAQRARRALPHAHEDTRFDPLALTLSLWWSAVQIQLGKQPRIL